MHQKTFKLELQVYLTDLKNKNLRNGAIQMGFLIAAATFVIGALIVLIVSVNSFKFNFIKKLFLILCEISVSISIPTVIGFSFKSSFPDYYEHGFLSGLGLILVALIMILLNIALFSPLLNSFYRKYITKGKDALSYFNVSLIMILVVVTIQICLTFLIENPLNDPPGMF